ncbi:MAG: hypothetical protein KDA73_12400 [Rhodobacteraceae bacterium]|nr:hypothetical protein [Paracoccaceae bacterium]
MSQDALDLLESAAAVLRDAAPSLPGAGRYTALLTANAIDTARRDLALGQRSETARAAIPAEAAAIRAGHHDDDVALYEKLHAYAAVRAWIADPTSVSADERIVYIGEASR